MPLTIRTAGNHPHTNIIGAQWFNDYYNLLTGVTVDQQVTIANTVTVQGVVSLANPSATVKGKINQNGSVSFDGGLITSDGSGHLSIGSMLFPGSGKLSRIAMGGGTVNGGGPSTFTHNLGVTPTVAFILPVSTYWANINSVSSSTITVAENGSDTFQVWYVVMA
jgi:hypothetical protein